MPEHWCLDENKRLFRSADPKDWLRSMERYHHVAEERVGTVRVSTIFIGIAAHTAFLDRARSQLFERSE